MMLRLATLQMPDLARFQLQMAKQECLSCECIGLEIRDRKTCAFGYDGRNDGNTRPTKDPVALIVSLLRGRET